METAEEYKPTVRELYEKYHNRIETDLIHDKQFENACRNSDRQNAYDECKDAVKRAVLKSADTELYRLFFDNQAFHNRFIQELFNDMYPRLSFDSGRKNGATSK